MNKAFRVQCRGEVIAIGMYRKEERVLYDVVQKTY